MIQTCYMCEKEKTSREHVPPKCIFPEKKDLPEGFDFRKNLIKVPSCDTHNSHKSQDDEYLMFILSCTLQGNEHKDNHFISKIMRAIERKPHVYSSFMSNLKPIYLRDESGIMQESACFKVNLERFDNIMQHLSCGLYYHHYKKKWVGGFKIFTNAFVEIDAHNAPEVNKTIQDVNARVSKAFSDSISFGENNKIFQYKLVSNDKNQHAINMVFYEGIEITVLLNSI